MSVKYVSVEFIKVIAKALDELNTQAVFRCFMGLCEL